MGDVVRQKGIGAETEGRQKENLRDRPQGTYREGWGRQRQVEEEEWCTPNSATPTGQRGEWWWSGRTHGEEGD